MATVILPFLNRLSTITLNRLNEGNAHLPSNALNSHKVTQKSMMDNSIDKQNRCRQSSPQLSNVVDFRETLLVFSDFCIRYDLPQFAVVSSLLLLYNCTSLQCPLSKSAGSAFRHMEQTPSF